MSEFLAKRATTVDELIEALQQISGIGGGHIRVIVQTDKSWPAGNGVKYDPLVAISEAVLMDLRYLPSGLFKDGEVPECVIVIPYEEESDDEF